MVEFFQSREGGKIWQAEIPLKFTFVEHWATEQDMNHHINGEPAARWERNAGHLRATDVTIRVYETIWE